MCEIICKLSKNGNKYFVLCVNGEFVSFDSRVIEKVAMSVGVSNIDLKQLNVGECIKI